MVLSWHRGNSVYEYGLGQSHWTLVSLHMDTDENFCRWTSFSNSLTPLIRLGSFVLLVSSVLLYLTSLFVFHEWCRGLAYKEKRITKLVDPHLTVHTGTVLPSSGHSEAPNREGLLSRKVRNQEQFRHFQTGRIHIPRVSFTVLLPMRSSRTLIFHC